MVLLWIIQILGSFKKYKTVFITRENVFFRHLIGFPNSVSPRSFNAIAHQKLNFAHCDKNYCFLHLKMHHIYLYEVEKSVLISRLLKVIKNRSPFNAVYEKKWFKRGQAMEYSTQKPLRKTFDSRKIF